VVCVILSCKRREVNHPARHERRMAPTFTQPHDDTLDRKCDFSRHILAPGFDIAAVQESNSVCDWRTNRQFVAETAGELESEI